MKDLSKCQRGQALLVIVLIMFVGLTVSLTLISRTTSDIKFSREFEESSRALSAAEAGIEDALRDITIAGSGSQPIGDATYEVDSALASGGTESFSLGKIEKENVGTVWLAEQDESSPYADSTITLCWKEVDASLPDVEAIILYKEGINIYKVARAFYDHTLVGGTGDCGNPGFYSYVTDISLPSSVTLLVLRLKPIGGDAFVAVDPPGANSLPSQGTEIVSTGKAGDTRRKVRVVKSYPTWPEIFDYVLFSGTNLTK